MQVKSNVWSLTLENITTFKKKGGKTENMVVTSNKKEH